MSYKIVVDSCCELPEELKHDPRYEIVPLTLIVGDSYERLDDDGFDQKEFLQTVAECPVSPSQHVLHRRNIWKHTAQMRIMCM